mmetsp:Transcript_17068/g.33393  ORF Transcript_17068/g.33393 Transcript_17068/m.33393 type:complete len:370 (-) Transcript_17068:293-1402(-)
MNLQDAHTTFFVRLWQLNLAIKTTRTHQGRIQYVGAVSGGDNLDLIVRSKTIKLVEELQHSTLHLTVTRLVTIKTLTTNGINLVDKNNRTTILALFTSEFKGITHKLRTITDEHLHKLGSCDLKENAIGLGSAGTCQEGLASSRRAIQKSTLGSLDSNSLKAVGMNQRQNNSFFELLDLGLTSTDITVALLGFLIKFHSTGTRVILRWKLVENQVAIFVGCNKILRGQVLVSDKANNWEENGLSCRGLNDSRLSLTAIVHIDSTSILMLVLLVFTVKNFHDVANKPGKLLVHLDLFDVFLNTLRLGVFLVAKAVLLTTHNTNLVLQEPDALFEVICRQGHDLGVQLLAIIAPYSFVLKFVRGHFRVSLI